MKKVKLAGATWVVKETDDIHELGRCEHNTQTIFINKNQNKQGKELTFIHELVHAILFTMGEMEHDERFVEGFAQLLYQYEQQKV